MTSLGELLRAIDTLERIQNDLASIASRTDEQRKRDLIALRRDISAQIALVSQLAEPVISATGDTQLLQAYRTNFSRMRSIAALHQANWPAVTLGERVAEFRASSATVAEANREFIAWIRKSVSTRNGE